MKFNNRTITDLTLAELNAADWELAAKEASFNESLKHSKFEKLSPKPQLGEVFVKLRNEIKETLNKFNTAGLQIEEEDK